MKKGLLQQPFSIVNSLFSICEYQKIRFFSSMFLKISLSLSNVAEIPVAINVPLKNVSASEDDSIVLSCKLTKPGKPVKWYKDGKILKDGIDCKISSDGCEYTLKLPKAKSSDAGTYTMKCDKIDTSAKVTIKGEKSQVKKVPLWKTFSVVNSLHTTFEYLNIFVNIVSVL